MDFHTIWVPHIESKMIAPNGLHVYQTLQSSMVHKNKYGGTVCCTKYTLETLTLTRTYKQCSEIFKGARVGRHNWRTSLGGCNFRLIALQRKKGESDAHLNGLIYLLQFQSICQKCLHASGNGTSNSYNCSCE